MKRKKKSFSLRGYRFIDGFIWEIFDFFHLPHQNKDLYQCAWVAFLSAYQERPLSFSRTNSPGWMRAYHIIWDALAKEQKCTNIWRYKYTLSLIHILSWLLPADLPLLYTKMAGQDKISCPAGSFLFTSPQHQGNQLTEHHSRLGSGGGASRGQCPVRTSA